MSPPLFKISALANGRFVATRLDYSDISVGSGVFGTIKGHMFAANGVKLGPEFQANAVLDNAQSQPTITTLSDGRFVIALSKVSALGNDSHDAIGAQVFTADSAKSGGQFLVNTATSGCQVSPAMAELADGRILFTSSDDLDIAIVRGQIFDLRLAAVVLNGTLGADDYPGTLCADVMRGSFGDDSLNGGTGDNMLIGGAGVDKLTGGTGIDRFVFATAVDVGNAALHDTITDFGVGIDKRDLSAIVAGQTFISAGRLTGVAGQIRHASTIGYVYGDTNGDGTPDYVLEITNLPALTVADLVLCQTLTFGKCRRLKD